MHKTVKAAPGRIVCDPDLGTPIPETPTRIAVTPLIERALRDGDLVLCPSTPAPSSTDAL